MVQRPETHLAGDLASTPAAQKEYELLKILAEHYFGSMLVTDDRGRFLYVSDGTCRLLGVDRETLLQLSIYDTLKGYCFATSASSIKTLETKQECLSNHTLTASGRQVLALSRPHFGPDGELQYVPTYSWDEEELYTLLEKFDQERDNVRNVIRFMQGTDKTPSMIIAESDAMVKLLEYADHVAAVDSTVILYGESGSGKEMFAKYIHARSDRADQVFIPINCASLPPSLLEEEMFGYERGTFTGGSKDGRIGLFEFADKGTIFLDEIGEMSLELQAKLLRIIETGEVKRLGSNRIQKCDVRIIAATNRNLREMVEEKAFRADLYYRLNVLTMENEVPQQEASQKERPEPKTGPIETPVASELQLSTGQAPAKNSAPEPTPPQPSKELHPGDKVYVAGFGWVEYEGPNHSKDGTDIYENGNKIGIIG